jgi:hypothetical protein
MTIELDALQYVVAACDRRRVHPFSGTLDHRLVRSYK